jgi:hypothetical protein
MQQEGDAAAAQAAPDVAAARVDEILQALAPHSGDVSALRACIASLTEVECASLPGPTRQRLLDAALRELRAHADAPVVLSAVCSSMLLSALLGEHEPPPETTRALADGRLVDELVAVLRRHEDDAVLHDAVSRALVATLTAQSPELVARAAAAGALDAVADGVRRHGGTRPRLPLRCLDDDWPRYRGLEALSTLLGDAPKCDRARALAQGTSQGVVRAMRLHIADAEAQLHGCGSLGFMLITVTTPLALPGAALSSADAADVHAALLAALAARRPQS